MQGCNRTRESMTIAAGRQDFSGRSKKPFQFFFRLELPGTLASAGSASNIRDVSDVATVAAEVRQQRFAGAAENTYCST